MIKIAKILVLGFLPLFLAAQVAEADESVMIVLSCSGTSKYMTAPEGSAPEQISNFGLVVNLSQKTVAFAGYVVPIETADETNVSFKGEQKLGEHLPSYTISGDIDRITGAVTVRMLHERVELDTIWELLCKPAKRLF
jgi:hypothetical protein